MQTGKPCFKLDIQIFNRSIIEIFKFGIIRNDQPRMLENEQRHMGRPVTFFFQNYFVRSNHHAGAICVFQNEGISTTLILVPSLVTNYLFENERCHPTREQVNEWRLRESTLNSKATVSE